MAALVTACLVLIGGVTAPPVTGLPDESPSLELRVPEIPLAAVGSTAPPRPEKQALSKRTTLHKPARTVWQVTASQQAGAAPAPRAAGQTSRALPRRTMPARQTPRAPDDPSH